jgi:hypothetical protein
VLGQEKETLPRVLQLYIGLDKNIYEYVAMTISCEVKLKRIGEVQFI